MISVNSIRTYMECPRKLYNQKKYPEMEENNLELKYKKDLVFDIQDHIHRNVRNLDHMMNLDEIIAVLKVDDEYFIEKYVNNLDLTTAEKHNLRAFALNYSDFFVRSLAIRVEKFLEIAPIDGNTVLERIITTSMYNYFMKDNNLEICGTCDKIEIVKGKYHPVKLNFNLPPVSGNWDGDCIELVANALLVEEEFSTEVFVGFMDYVNMGERRPVVMDSKLRKGLFKLLIG